MSGPTRPIPISHGHRSQRGSPIGTIDAGEDDADASNGMISQSCPVNGHGGAAFFRPLHHPPPRAPVIGSLPEPSFMLGGARDEMPELVLPPPAQREGQVGSAPGRREDSVVQVASSCPVDIGFFRQGSPSQQHSWTPSPRVPDGFDLSKSPALAVMSAMRQGRRPSFDQRRDSNGDQLSQSHERYRGNHAQSFGMASSRRISDLPFRPQPSNSFVSSQSSFFFGQDRLENEIQSQEFALENLSLDGTPPSSTESAASSDGSAVGLPPRRPERRGSYDGGIFHFEDQ